MTKPEEEEEEPLPQTLLASARALPMRLVCVEGEVVAGVVVVSPEEAMRAKQSKGAER